VRCGFGCAGCAIAVPGLVAGLAGLEVGDDDALADGGVGDFAQRLDDGLGLLRGGRRWVTTWKPATPWLSQNWATAARRGDSGDGKVDQDADVRRLA